MGGIDLKQELLGSLRTHPRVEFQKILEPNNALIELAAAMPAFVPFGGRTYTGCLWVADWDHRLPSRQVVLRLYAYYDKAALTNGQRTFQLRKEQIAAEELFPEFDVSDFAGFQADESYEAEWNLAESKPNRYRLVNSWKREIDDKLGRQAEFVARESAAFKEVAKSHTVRPAGLGDLEAAEWMSPSETGEPNWCIEVWYLRSFNGMVGEGTAFLVDLDGKTVKSQREFQFRAG